MELDQHCPQCEAEHTFWLAAKTELHLGTKTKWRCPECDYGFVKIDDTVDTSASV